MSQPVAPRAQQPVSLFCWIGDPKTGHLDEDKLLRYLVAVSKDPESVTHWKKRYEDLTKHGGRYDFYDRQIVSRIKVATEYVFNPFSWKDNDKNNDFVPLTEDEGKAKNLVFGENTSQYGIKQRLFAQRLLGALGVKADAHDYNGLNILRVEGKGNIEKLFKVIPSLHAWKRAQNPRAWAKSSDEKSLNLNLRYFSEREIDSAITLLARAGVSATKNDIASGPDKGLTFLQVSGKDNLDRLNKCIPGLPALSQPQNHRSAPKSSRSAPGHHK
jgi:hypothetical protein